MKQACQKMAEPAGLTIGWCLFRVNIIWAQMSASLRQIVRTHRIERP